MKNKFKLLLKKTLYNELFVMEMLFFIGFIIINITNFIINRFFGSYFLGLSFIALSIFLFLFRKGVK